MSFRVLAPRVVESSFHRIKEHVFRTRVLELPELNALLNHKIKFKLELEQRVGSFKVRGVLNHLLYLKEKGIMPGHVVAYSSGNHGQALAWAASLLGIKSTIILPRNASMHKQQSIIKHGAELIVTDTRQEAEDMMSEYSASGVCAVPPSDDDMVIAGNGTACFEAMQEMLKVDAVFVPCGGGGLVSGTYLATKLLSPNTKVFAAEPLNANDAAISLRKKKIFRFETSPNTIADGARTLGITPRIFHYLEQIEHIYEIPEDEILFWCVYLNQALSMSCEPTAALAMAAAFRWLKTQPPKKEVLVILSGGNISNSEYDVVFGANKLQLSGGGVSAYPELV